MAQAARVNGRRGNRPSLPDGLRDAIAGAFDGIEASGHEILRLLLRSGADALGVKDTAIMVPKGPDQLGFLEATNAGLLKTDLPPVPVGSSIAGFVYMSAQAMSFDQAAASPEFFDKIDKSVGHSTNEYLAAPVVGGGEMLGVLTFVNRTGKKKPFSPGEIELASRYAALCGLVMQHNERSRQLVSETLNSIRPSFEAAASPVSAPPRAHEHLQVKSAIVDALDELGDGELDLVRDLIDRLRGGSQLL